MLHTLTPEILGLGMPGPFEMMLLAGLGLLIFGKRLPEVGRSLGKGIVEFKRGLKEAESEIMGGGGDPPAASPPAMTALQRGGRNTSLIPIPASRSIRIRRRRRKPVATARGRCHATNRPVIHRSSSFGERCFFRAGHQTVRQRSGQSR